MMSEDLTVTSGGVNGSEAPTTSEIANSPIHGAASLDEIVECSVEDQDNFSDISEDSLTSLPGSPTREVDPSSKPVSCRWEGCTEPLQPSAHALVTHLQTDHFGLRRAAKYTCEWEDCSRKGILQPSRFALVSHMRSHTGEKPFICLVPECDRSFTRSDALAKHLRTVHETESFKISPPIISEVGSKTNPLEDERPTLPFHLKDLENDEGRSIENNLYLQLKQMNGHDRLSELLQSPLSPSLNKSITCRSLIKEFLKSNPIDSDLLTPTSEAILNEEEEGSIAQLKQIFESLKRHLIWTLQHEAKLTQEFEKLQSQKYQVLVENERILDELITRDIPSDKNAADLLVWPTNKRKHTIEIETNEASKKQK